MPQEIPEPQNPAFFFITGKSAGATGNKQLAISHWQLAFVFWLRPG